MGPVFIIASEVLNAHTKLSAGGPSESPFPEKALGGILFIRCPSSELLALSTTPVVKSPLLGFIMSPASAAALIVTSRFFNPGKQNISSPHEFFPQKSLVRK